MAFFTLPHLVVSLGVLKVAPSARTPRPDESVSGRAAGDDSDDARVARDGVILSGAALHRTAPGVRTDGPAALTPVVGPELAQELLDGARSAMLRDPAQAIRAQANLPPSAVAPLLG